MAQEYKLKGISSLDIKENDKQEVEVEGIEEGKVLLVNSGGKIHAMTSKCTHFGAPLKLGVVGDGRITCPWHGACFNISSGDVEDAPALDPLGKFEIEEKNGAVYIKGDEKTIKASRRAANHKCAAASGGEEIVVVGGGSGTIGFLQALRENSSKAKVTLIHKEPYLPVDRTKLSKALISDPAKVQLRPQEWFDDASITTVQDEVSSIDLDKKVVSTKSGKSYSATKIVLATGGTPNHLPLDGLKGDLENVFVLRFVTDVKQINDAVGESKGKKIVVVGSSFIGMEVANAIAKDNDVTVVGMEKTPLERILGAEVGTVCQKNLEKSGVKFKLDASVEKASPSESDKSKVGAVHLKDGTVLPADIVILGVGVKPATEYLNDSGLALQKDGSILVNESFAIADKPGIYAIGDIATYPYHGPGGSGKPVRIEHWNVAQNAGRSVGRALARPGAATTIKPFIPVFWSAQGAQLRYCGHTPNGFDAVRVRGEPGEGKFAAYYAKDGVVVAVATMGMDPVMAKCVELMKRGEMLSWAQIEKGEDPLEAGL